MFRAKVTGLGKLKAEFASATANLKTIVQTAQEEMAADWKRGAQADAPIDQGTLKAGITWYRDGENVAIVSNAFYSPFMEFGTKGKYRPIPGTESIAVQFKGYKGGDFGTFLRMITEWVRRKGITGRYSVKTRRRLGGKGQKADEDLRAAWPIAMSILKNGVSPHPFFFKQSDIVWPKMIRNIERRIKQESKVSVILPSGIQRPQIVTV
jgi:hypothetical protein